MSEHRCFSCKAHGEHTAPVMGDENDSLLVNLAVLVNAILDTESNDELRQFLHHICARIAVQALGTAISGQVNSHHRGFILQSLLADDMPPNSPTVRKAVDKNHQRLLRGQGFRRTRHLVTDEVELESAGQSQDVVGKATEFLAEIPQTVTSYVRYTLADALVMNKHIVPFSTGGMG